MSRPPCLYSRTSLSMKSFLSSGIQSRGLRLFGEWMEIQNGPLSPRRPKMGTLHRQKAALKRRRRRKRRRKKSSASSIKGVTQYGKKRRGRGGGKGEVGGRRSDRGFYRSIHIFNTRIKRTKKKKRFPRAFRS